MENETKPIDPREKAALDYLKRCYERILEGVSDKVFNGGINGGLTYEQAAESANKAIENYFSDLSERKCLIWEYAEKEAKNVIEFWDIGSEQVWKEVYAFDDGTGYDVQANYEEYLREEYEQYRKENNE